MLAPVLELPILVLHRNAQCLARAGWHRRCHIPLGFRLEADEPLAFGGHGALDEVQVVEGDGGTHGDAFEGIVGDVAGDADLPGD